MASITMVLPLTHLRLGSMHYFWHTLISKAHLIVTQSSPIYPICGFHYVYFLRFFLLKLRLHKTAFRTIHGKVSSKCKLSLHLGFSSDLWAVFDLRYRCFLSNFNYLSFLNKEIRSRDMPTHML